MAEFLTSQLDYIFFFYGTAFLLLIPICLFLRRRSCRHLPWIWLGWFGAIHGVNEYLTLLALSLEPGPVFAFVRLGCPDRVFCLFSRIWAGRYPHRLGPWAGYLLDSVGDGGSGRCRGAGRCCRNLRCHPLCLGTRRVRYGLRWG